MATLCDICGKPLPSQRTGRPRVRHAGACAVAGLQLHHRLSQARWVNETGPVLGDDPTPVIEAKLAAAEAHVRATRPFEIDGWQRRGETV